jgi:hypothetical protein
MHSKPALLSAVLVIGPPLPLQAHDLYSHLTDERGASCCDDRDCRPALYRFTASGLQMFVDRRWIDVPNERVQYRILPGDKGETGGGHWCGAAYEPNFSNIEDLYVTKCAVLPPQSAAARTATP